MPKYPKFSIDIDLLKNLYLEQRMSMDAIARQLGCSRKVVRSRIVALGIPRRGVGPLPGPEHPGWKGGVTVGKYGSILRYVPNHPYSDKRTHYYEEHRLVMEKILGRHLIPKEVVHHKDGDPSNNAPENLQLFCNNGSHLAETLKGKCPKWTQDGKRRIAEAVRLPRKAIPEHVDIRKMYEDDLMTVQAISDLAGCSGDMIARRLRSMGVQLRCPGETRRKYHFPPADELRVLYQTHEMTDLCRRFGCSNGALYYALHDAGIPLKGSSDRIRQRRLEISSVQTK